jgi:hypothetical protein
MLRTSTIAAVLLALVASACAPSPAMRPRMAKAQLNPPTAPHSGEMQQSCAGSLCFPYEAEGR